MNSIIADSIYAHPSDNDEVSNEDQEIVHLPGEELDHAEFDSEQVENDGVHSESLVADSRVRSRKAEKNNTFLYGGVGALALLMLGGYLITRPATSHHPIQVMQTTAIHQGDVAPTGLVRLAPAAVLANVPMPLQPSAVLRQQYIPQQPSTELSELDNLRGSTPNGVGQWAGQPVATPLSSHPPIALPGIPSAPGALQTTAHGSSANGSSAAGKPSTPVGGPHNVSSTSAGNHVQVAFSETAAEPGSHVATPVKPMTVAPAKPVLALQSDSALVSAPVQSATSSTAQQTQVLQLVTEIASIERADGIRQAVLTGEVQQLSVTLTNTMADYNRRLSLLEAQTAVNGALQAGSNTSLVSAMVAPPDNQSVHAVPVYVPQPSPRSSRASAASTPSMQASVPQYHVQAASPGYAMLSVVGGAAPPLEVQVGDIIPGYGQVTAVVQQGDSWVVQTKSGNIN
jgi:hypothetical protein